MINAEYWKDKDADWHKKREEKWPRFELWILRDLSENQDHEKCIENAKKFYDSGYLPPKDIYTPQTTVRFRYYLVLHPELTVESARELIDELAFLGESVKTRFWTHYLFFSYFKNYLEDDLIPEAYPLTVIEAFYGKSLADAEQYLGFDKKKDGFPGN